MTRQFISIIEEKSLGSFASVLPSMKFIEVMGMPIKDPEGKEYLVLAMPMPVAPESSMPTEPEVKSDGQG